MNILIYFSYLFPMILKAMHRIKARLAQSCLGSLLIHHRYLTLQELELASPFLHGHQLDNTCRPTSTVRQDVPPALRAQCSVLPAESGPASAVPPRNRRRRQPSGPGLRTSAQESSLASERPRRNTRKSFWFKDYVSQ
ncbi:hypothetical protein V5799_009836 [Amblyomma americanum]|uniref:Uncharacterized protein n=1 Tax=Amblyomma americanum TaxID=6943 RepID=A0AAQ4F9R7_AMBAM